MDAGLRVTEATLCHIIDGDKLLLKMAVRGVSKGKWNAAGGKVEDGESPLDNAIRETYEETGLTVSNLFYHGLLKFYLNGKMDLSFAVHLFSTTSFKGQLRSTEEGEVRWFKFKDVPFDLLWADDLVWWELMLDGRRFDGSFYFDEQNKTLTQYAMFFY